MNSNARLRRPSAWLAIVIGLTTLVWGCARVPRHYVRMAEPGVTLTTLMSDPETYRGKVVILGGTILEEEETAEYLWLRLKNRPLDDDYVPRRPVDLHSQEGGQYWVMVTKRQFPRDYRQWARMTVVGRVTGTQRLETEPVLALLYVRGWDSSGSHDRVWENASEPSVPAGLGGGFGGRRP